MNEQPEVIKVNSSRRRFGVDKKQVGRNSGNENLDDTNRMINGKEITEQWEARRIDFERAVEIVAGREPTKNEIKEIEDAEFYRNSAIKSVEICLRNNDLEEGSIGCDLENAISEAIGGDDPVDVKIRNTSNIDSFKRKNINAIAYIYVNGINQMPIAVTLKIIPEGYTNRFTTRANVEFAVPDVSSRDNTEGEYWNQLDEIANDIKAKMEEIKEKIAFRGTANSSWQSKGMQTTYFKK